MSFESKFSELVLKLTRATTAKEVKWRPSAPPAQLTSATDSKIFEYFSTKYNSINVGIYEIRFQSLSEEFAGVYWNSRIELVLLTTGGDVAQTYLNDGFNYSLNNLHDLAKSSAYDVENLLDRALGKE